MPNGSTPRAGRVMTILGFSLVGVYGRVNLGNLLTLHGIWRLLGHVDIDLLSVFNNLTHKRIG